MKASAVTLSVTLALALLAASISAGAQPVGRTFRLAYFSLYRSDDPEVAQLLAALRQGLLDQGYLEGRNFSLSLHFGQGRPERLPDLARELVNLKPDLISAGNTQAIQAIKNATATIPIVMASGSDPLAAGLVPSLAKPGGNVTGLSIMSPELNQKRLELLRDVAPQVVRVGVVWNPLNAATVREWEETQAGATAMKLQLTSLEARGPNDLSGVFQTAVKGGVQGLLVLSDGGLFADRQRLVAFAREHRLPSIFWRKEFASAGGFLAYGPSYTALYRKIGVFVDKILKGAPPGDLPVEQPTKFELTINLQTAKALGLTIPQSLLSRADEVIQ